MNVFTLTLVSLPLLVHAASFKASPIKDFTARYAVYHSNGKAENRFAGSIHVSGFQMRLENELVQPRMVFLVDLQNARTVTLWPERRAYLAGDTKAGRALATNLVDPCQSARNAGGTCKKVGQQTRNGRKTDAFEVSFPGKGVLRAYQDRQLKVPVRVESPGGIVNEMTQLKVAPQSPELFKVPKGYKRVTRQEALSFYSRSD